MDSPSAVLPAAASPVTDSPVTGSPAAAESASAWLTTTLRPAGSLDGEALRRLGAALGQLAGASDMVIVDLAAVAVRDPRALVKALREPAAAFERAGRCLLVMGAAPALTAELDRAEVAVVTLAADAVPRPAAASGDDLPDGKTPCRGGTGRP
jgi:hypothetical protein